MQPYNDPHLVRLVEETGFVAGAIWSIHDPKLVITHPISSVFNGALMGITIATGSKIVSKMIPDKAKPYFAGLIAVSAGCYLLNKIYQKATNQLPDEPPNSSIVTINVNTN
jgi:hypothetical protein